MNQRALTTSTLTLIAFTIATTAAEPFIAPYHRFFQSNNNSNAQGGLLLLTELNCTSCHQEGALPPKIGPDLQGTGNRAQQSWLEKFLASPQSVKPGTTMPDMLHGFSGKEKTKAIRALTAFLSRQRKPFPVLKSTASFPVAHEFWLKGSSKRGEQLYHQIGCVACHKPKSNDPEIPPKTDPGMAPRKVPSIPLGDLKAKYTYRSLSFFLLNPEAIRPGQRMPNFHLLPHEAADIATYLLNGLPKRVTAMASVGTEAEAKEGQRLFRELNCANCHTLNGIQPKSHTPLQKLDIQAKKSCISKTPKGAPRFDLHPGQQKALITALTDLPAAIRKWQSSKEQLNFRLLQLNCYACHQRDKRGGIASDRRAYFETEGHVDLGDEGKLPPSLNGIGQKLKASWLKKVLTADEAIRPHMLARMPKYSSSVATTLTNLFHKVDGIKQPSEQALLGNTKKLAKIGRELMTTGGCAQCHAIEGERMLGVAGVEIGRIHQRLHPQWFRDFLLDPAKLKPGTRMPTLFTDGKTPFPELLGGSVDQQIAAIWAYLKTSDKLPLPEGMAKARSQSFELTPDKKPILLRTFMKDVGPLAIAVGFPQKVHLAFDAEECRAAQVWRGRFLDAHGTWFNRFVPPAKPLGKDVKSMPPGRILVTKDKAQKYRFNGYRLDTIGIPTFLYRYGPLHIEDRFEPKANGLKRQITITPNGKKPFKVWLRGHSGKGLKYLNVFHYKTDNGMSVKLMKGADHAGELRSSTKQTEWLIPLTIQKKKIIEVIYQW